VLRLCTGSSSNFASETKHGQRSKIYGAREKRLAFPLNVFRFVGSLKRHSGRGERSSAGRRSISCLIILQRYYSVDVRQKVRKTWREMKKEGYKEKLENAECWRVNEVKKKVCNKVTYSLRLRRMLNSWTQVNIFKQSSKEWRWME